MLLCPSVVNLPPSFPVPVRPAAYGPNRCNTLAIVIGYVNNLLTCLLALSPSTLAKFRVKNKVSHEPRDAVAS